ncbi:MAG: hypothetical protein JNL74_11565 [Fibrobacteres bacterium]|nr:hypothetical protein [Fibrobacterota bacterium]
MFDDHDRFTAKNRMLAQSYEILNTEGKVKDRLGGKQTSDKPMSCFNCKKKLKCLEFKRKSSGGTDGAISIDTNTTFICDKYDPIPDKDVKVMSGKDVKNAMKAAMRGRL